MKSTATQLPPRIILSGVFVVYETGGEAITKLVGYSYVRSLRTENDLLF